MSGSAPALPPGIGAAIAGGRPVTPEDISGSPTTTTPGSPAPPGASSGIDASSLMMPLDDLKQKVGQSIDNLQQSKSTSLTGQAQVAGGAAEIAGGAALVNTADAQTQLTRKQNDDVVYSMFGTTPGKPSALIADMAQRIQSHEVDIQNKRDALQGKLDANFTDNPMQWLVNQLTIPFDQEALGNEIQGRNDDLDVLHRLAIATQEGTAQDAAAAYTVDTMKLAGLNKQAAGDATMRAGQSALQLGSLLTGISGGVTEAARTDYSAAAQTFGLTENASQDDYKRVMGLREDARQTELSKVQLDIASMNDLDLNKKVAAQTDLDQRVRNISNVVGANILNYSQLQAMADGKQKQIFMDMMWNPDIQSGHTLSMVGPAQALDFVNMLNMPMANPGQEVVRQKLTKLQSQYITSLGPTAKTLYTPEQISINTNNYIKQTLVKEAHAIPDTGGFYSPPSLLATLGLPGMDQNPLTPALAPLANPQGNKDGNYPTQAKDVIAAASVMIKNGKLTPADAAKAVSGLYKGVMLSNDAAHGYSVFGIPSPSKDGKFNASIPSGGDYGAWETRDLANPVEMETFFTRMRIQQMVNPQGMTGVP